MLMTSVRDESYQEGLSDVKNRPFYDTQHGTMCYHTHVAPCRLDPLENGRGATKFPFPRVEFRRNSHTPEWRRSKWGGKVHVGPCGSRNIVPAYVL